MEDVLTIGDVYVDVTVQQLTDSSVYNSLTMVEKIAEMNEFNNEFNEISADAWNSTINQVIGGVDVLTITDSSATEELDIVSEKVALDDINSHETFSSVNVHPFVAGSAVEFLDQAVP